MNGPLPTEQLLQQARECQCGICDACVFEETRNRPSKERLSENRLDELTQWVEYNYVGRDTETGESLLLALRELQDSRDDETSSKQYELALERIMRDVEGVGIGCSKDFHREALNSVHTIAAEALAGYSAEKTAADQSLVNRIEELAAGNVTGCGTCTTIIDEIRRSENGEEKP